MDLVRLFLNITAAYGLLLSSSVYAREPLYSGLGSYTRKVTTDAPLAQRYFDQGLAWLYGFNHEAAIRSFQQAAELDSECAMAHWGTALAAGPHINYPALPLAMADLAWKELTLAQQAAHALPVECALIDALSYRYANPEPQDRAALDRAYANAMRQVWKKYPKDPDVGALFAESMLDVRPWDQWTHEGQPKPGTDEIIATLDSVLRLNPEHPLANHLYIHALEASPYPERADKAANLLRHLQPGVAHMLHMPSHIDIRCGRWQEAIVANEKAVEADRRYLKDFDNRPARIMSIYAAHDQHMLAYAALMTGQSKLALQHIQQMVADLPPEFFKDNPWASESFAALPMEVMVRFGEWDDILAETDKYPDYIPFTRAFHYAARAVAFAAKGDTENARKAQAVFAERSRLVPKETAFGNNNAGSILPLVECMLEGEILVAESKLDNGLEQLRAAVKLEDALYYDEPPSWMIPIRHSIGATLMKAGRFAEAEQVYREDLHRVPENGWSLYGLAESLRKQGKASEASAAYTRFQKIWANADLKIRSSCLCQPRT
jgi:tetratricopeptide (TPR) repeat protein